MGRQGRELTTNAPLRSIFHILCIRNELGLPPKRMNPPSSRIVGAFLHSGYLAAAEQSRQNSNKLTGSEGRRRRSGWRLSARRSRSSTRAVTRSSSSGTNGRTPNSLAIASELGVRPFVPRSEEHTSELQSQSNLVCRLLLEKKKINAMR